MLFLIVLPSESGRQKGKKRLKIHNHRTEVENLHITSEVDFHMSFIDPMELRKPDKF
jgi:hypothetical protein